jgi:hypothetical protein
MEVMKMLLYANYTPSNQSSWNRPRVYAFASVERLVTATREIKASGIGTLEILTKEEAYNQTAVAMLYTGTTENGEPKKDGESIMVHGDGVRDTWDGKIFEITLAQTIKDERVPSITVYP